ncbi:hypothetical protein TRAPUB_11807 [Trametes pubescens]|uniref:Uncharacterized protein n=1 Tax=Trametes pubescens TaxID=154538 RepID=A0A1M2VVM7_TRAPU|nr:hypothetical protein TRAPUB_11807 [Trametes pubescens]
MAPDLAGHLEYLVGTAEESADREKRLLDEWSRYPIPGSNGVPPKEVSSDLGEDDEWDSILDFLQVASNASDGHSDDSIISSLLSKPDVEHLLPSLVSLLSSTKPDDAISEELVEMIGFDNIELSMQLLANRKDAVRELTAFLSGDSSQPQPPARQQPNGRSKGKQREVLRVLDQFRIRDANPNNLAASIERDKFKVIYV